MPGCSAGPRWWAGVLAGLAHGVLMTMALPPVGWWALVFAAPLPIAWAGRRGRGAPARTAWSCGLGALGFWAWQLSWIWNVSAPGFVPLCLFQSLWSVLLVYVVARLGRREGVAWSAAFPVLWAGVEFARGEVAAGGYAIALLGYPLIDAPVFSAPGAWLGVYCVGLLAAAPAGALLDATSERKGRRVGARVAMVVCAATWAGAWWMGRSSSAAPETWRVAVMQSNVPQDNKLGWTPAGELRDWERYESMMGALEPAGVDAVVWPETMMPGPTLEPEALEALEREQIAYRLETDEGPRLLEATHFAGELLALQGRLSVPMLVGEEAIEGLVISKGPEGRISFDKARRYNSVYLVEAGRVARVRYDKIRLTPFGETMPYISNFPRLERALLSVGARGMTFDLDAGRERTVFPMALRGGGVARAVTPICFETTVASACRRLVYDSGGRRRADVIVNLTNDGWFAGSDAAREQHLQIGRWRCLELGVPMVRAANTGISAIVDERGRVTGRLEARRDGLLEGRVDLGRRDATVYGAVGEVAGWSCVVAAGMMVVGALVPLRRGRAGHGGQREG